MRPFAILIGIDNAHGFGDRLVVGIFRTGKAREIIGIRDRHVADACRNRLQLVSVAAGWCLREIGNDAGGPFTRLLLAPARDQRAGQRKIVDVGARAHAQAALEARIGEISIRIHKIEIGGALGHHDDTHAGGEAEPVIARLTQRFGNARSKHF